MENCIVREITDFNRLAGLFLLASSMKDENAKNYSIEKMQKIDILQILILDKSL